MLWIVEALIVSFFTFNFIKREKPKIVFFFLGFLFSIIAFVLRLPILYGLGLIDFENTFSSLLLSGTIIAIASGIINEIIRYLSLKRFLLTKSYKNGILFGIGWAAFTIIIFFQKMVFTFFSSHFSYFSAIEFNYITYNFLEFSFLLTTTLAQTVFIIFAVIKKKKRYILFSIFYSIFIFILADSVMFSSIIPEIMPAKIIAIIINTMVFFQYKLFR